MSDSEFALEDDCLGRWCQDTIELLLKPLDVDINVRDKDDEVWKDEIVKSRGSKKVE